MTDAYRAGFRIRRTPARLHTGSTVWADTAYRSQKNEKKIAGAGLTSKVHFRRPPGKPMPVHHDRARARIGMARIAVNMRRLLFRERKGAVA